MVPLVNVSRRGLPYPLRYPGEASTASRRADFVRPNNSVTSSSRRAWMNCCTCSRTKSSKYSQVLLAFNSRVVSFLFSMAHPPSLPGPQPGPVGEVSQKDTLPDVCFLTFWNWLGVIRGGARDSCQDKDARQRDFLQNPLAERATAFIEKRSIPHPPLAQLAK